MAQQHKQLPEQALQGFTKVNETLVRDVKTNPKDRIELEIGDIKQPDFKPQAKVKRWDNEVNLSIRRILPDSVAESVNFVDGKVVYEHEREEVHIYEKPDIDEDGGLEIELIVKDKPDTNKFEFSIETKGLLFFKQSELTPEEISQGLEREERVVNSYAVYHKTKSNNKEGDYEYRTGKFCHIYRPHIIDANGSEVWGDLDIDEERGVLTVIVPDDFLATAVYPVVVDPTLGYTAAGASSYIMSATGQDMLQRWQVLGSWNVSALTWYHNPNSGTRVVKPLIYDDSANLLGTGNIETTSGSSNIWGTESFSGGVSLSAGYYYFGYVNGNTYYNQKYDDGDGTLRNGGLTGSNNYTTPVDPHPGFPGTTIRLISIYATYTTSDTAPTVTTSAATNVNVLTYSATLNGNITATGTTSPTRRGFVISTVSQGAPSNVNPESSGYDEVIDESGTFGTGAFTGSYTIPTANTTYYYRAFAGNTGGYSYGSQQSFSVGPGQPVMLPYTDTVNRDDFGAYIRGYVSNTAGATVTSVGIVYDTVTRTDPGTAVPASSGYAGTANHSVSYSSDTVFGFEQAGLQPNTLYYYRVYGYNGTYYGYSGERTFRTSREGVRRVDTTQLIFNAIGPLGTSFPAFGQKFVARGPVLERFSVAIRQDTALTGTMRFMICPDNAGNPNLGSPIWTGSAFTPTNTDYSRYYETPGQAVTDGTAYWIVLDGASITAGTVRATTRPVTVYGEEGSQPLRYYNGSTWTEYTTASVNLDIEFSYPAPTVTSSAASNIQSNSFQANGNITSEGGEDVTERGFVLSTSTQSAPAAVSESSSLLDDESFETSIGDWISSGSTGWVRDSGGTPSTGTGPTTGQDGSWYMFVETSGGSNAAGSEDYLTYTLPGPGTVGDVDLYFHQYGATQGLLQLEGYDGNKWIPFWYTYQQNIDAWQQVTGVRTRFDGYSQIRFRSLRTVSGFTGDIAVDYIQVNEITPGAIASTPANTTYSDVYSESGSFSTGAFSQVITGLEPNTTYYYRAYAKNGAGYVYSTEQSFTTDQLPTTALNTADATNFGTDKTPTLAFTGTEPNSGADLTYDVAIYGSGSNSITTSFAGTGGFQGGNLINNVQDAVGQTFKGQGGLLHSVSFDLAKIGSPTGPIVVKIWAHTGTYGSTGVPTGSVLATSEPIDASTLPTWSSTSTFEFFFDASEQFQLQTGVPYVATIHHDGISGNYPVVKRYQDAAATHEGNFVYTATGASWSPIGTWDNNIIVKEVNSGFLLYKSSDTDAGFTGTPDSTDPFTSGQQVTFTVQAGDELKDRTYTWKARAWNPVNTNDVDYSWSATRTFTVDAVSTASQTRSLTYKSFGPAVSTTRSLKYTTTQPLVCLAGWNYKRQFEVLGSADGEFTDYTIPITVHYGSGTDSGSNVYLAGKCKTDFSDVRFTTEDGATLLEHFLDYKTDSSVAYFWVKIPYLPQSGSKFFYIAYGNSGASAAGTAIKSFFPRAIDFSTDTLVGLYSQDSNENYTVDGATNSIVFGNGAARSNNWKGVSVTSFDLTPNSHAIGFTLKVAGTQAEILGVGVDNQTTTIPPTSDNRIQQAYGTQSYNTTDGMPAYTGAGAEQYLEGELNLAGTYNYLTIIHDEDVAVNPTDTYRNIRLRQYTTNEPAVNAWLPEWFCGGPSVVLNTADGFSFGEDTTPTFEFTGTDTESQDIRYTIQVDKYASFERNIFESPFSPDDYWSQYGPSFDGTGYTFVSDGRSISGLDWKLTTQGSPTGAVWCEIYASVYDETWVQDGTSQDIYIPTGSPLATSQVVNVEDLGLANSTSAPANFTRFTFTTPYATTAGTRYVAVIRGPANSDSSNRLRVHTFGDYGLENVTGNNIVGKSGSSWYTDYYVRAILKVVSDDFLIEATSGTDAGFVNTIDGGDTDPFTSAQKISYTVQAGDELSAGTYYWRVYAIDPTGGNTYGQYSSENSFVIYTLPFQKTVNYFIYPFTKYLTDDFSNTSNWGGYGSGSFTVSNNTGIITNSTSNGQTLFRNWQEDNYTNQTFRASIDEGYILFELVDGSNADQSMVEYRIGYYDSGVDDVAWRLTNGNIEAITDDAGVVVRATTTYDPAVHRWLRIRETSGVLYWDYSPNCYDWTNFASLSSGIWSPGIVKPWFEAKTTNTGAVAKSITIANYNLPKPRHERSLQYVIKDTTTIGKTAKYTIQEVIPVTKSSQNTIITHKLPGTQIDGYKPNGSLSGTDVNATTWKGQSFTGDGNEIGSVSFYFTDIGTPVGDVFVEIYAHTGTFGTSGRPGNSSSALATSRAVDGSTLTVTSYPRTTFVFDTPYTTVNGTKYVAVLRGPSTSGSLRMLVDTSSSTHPGNACQTTDSGTTWTFSSTWDYKFEINQPGGTIRDLEYSVVDTTAVTKNIQYAVTATAPVITKSLQYAIPVLVEKTWTIATDEDAFYGTTFQTGGNYTDAQLNCGGWGDFYYSYIYWDLSGAPAASSVTDITLNMYSNTNVKNNPNAYIRRITSSWTEEGISLASHPGDSTTNQVLISPNPYSAIGWKSYDVTTLVTELIDGTYTNYGLKLHPTANNETNSGFASSNYGTNGERAPYLEFTYLGAPSQTRSMVYAVSPSYSQTKDLTYLTDATLSVTKSTKYTVIDTPAAKTRSLEYSVSPTTTEVENRNIKYTVTTTPAEKTRNVDYYVVNLGAVTKQAKYTITAPVTPLARTLEYTILIADNVQKATDYYILTTDSQNRDAAYYVMPTITETRDLTYTVETNITEVRNAQYTVVDPNAASKSTQYTVETTSLEQRGLEYQIITTASEARGVDYAILTQPSETRSNKYTVTSAVSTTRGVAYIVIGPTNMELQMKYTVSTTPVEKTRTVDYYILDTAATTKASQYAMVPSVSESRTVDYAIVSSHSETRDILYVVAANTYSREDTDVLRTDTADLSNIYTTTEYTNVATSDDTDTKQTGASRFQVHQYRVYNTNNSDFIRITWEGTPIVDATVANPLIVQMYNYNTAQWETRDSSSTAVTTADTTFTVTIDTADSDFYGPYNEVCTRVFRYQEDPEVLMTSVGSITPVSAYVYATTVSDGGLAIIDKGFVWATSSKSLPGNVPPASSGYTWYGSYDIAGPPDPWLKGLGGLTQTTTYYVRAYLQTSLGYEYSDNQLSFTTGSSQGGGGEI